MKNRLTYISVVMSCCLLAGGTIGIPNAYGLFYGPMAEALNVGQGAISLHMTISGIIAGLGAPFVARLIDHVKIKYIIFVGIGCIATSGIAIALATHIWIINFFAFIRGIGFSCCSGLFITIILGNWFEKMRGTMIGIAMSFSGILGAIVSPLLSSAINLYGYRFCYIICIIGIILCVLPCALFCTLNPETKGLHAFGLNKNTVIIQHKKKRLFTNLDVDLHLKSIVFICTAIMAIEIVSVTSLNSHLPGFALSKNYDISTSASLLSIAMIANVTFKFIIGIMIDYIGTYWSIIIMQIINIIGLTLMLLIPNNSSTFFLIAGFLYGAIYSTSAVGVPSIIRYIYGNKQYAKVYAYISLFTSIFTSIAITMVGSLYDMFGTYTVPFAVMVIFSTSSLFFLTTSIKHAKIKKLS